MNWDERSKELKNTARSDHASSVTSLHSRGLKGKLTMGPRDVVENSIPYMLHRALPRLNRRCQSVGGIPGLGGLRMIHDGTVSAVSQQ